LATLPGEGAPLKEEVRIYLRDPRPVKLRNFRTSAEESNFIKGHVAELRAKGILEVSRSEYSSPILLVPKKDGGRRMCVDYRLVNERIYGDQSPLLLINELFNKARRGLIFSKIDLASGFYQIPVKKECRGILAFSDGSELYTFTVLPFGLKISPAAFCRILNAALRPCWAFTATFMDDILVFSDSVDEHAQHLLQVLRCLGATNFKIALKKTYSRSSQRTVSWAHPIKKRAQNRPCQGRCHPAMALTLDCEAVAAVLGHGALLSRLHSGVRTPGRPTLRPRHRQGGNPTG